MSRVTNVATVLLILATLTACSNDEPRSTAPAARAAASTLPAASPSPSPSAGPLALGTTSHATDTVDVTVYAYRPRSAPQAPPPDTAGYAWASIDVQACVLPTTTVEVVLWWRPWTLVFPGGAVIEASNITFNQFPQPQYPNDSERLVPAGRCVRGWITFAVPADRTPKVVEYQPRGSLVDWAVS